MNENLVGYLLNALDPEEERDVEEYLRQNPEAKRQLELLRRSLQPLEYDRDSIDPPQGLAASTIERVTEQFCKELPRSPATPAARTLAFSPPIWRRLDVLVAASILIIVAGVSTPLILNLRNIQNRLLCQQNLKEIGDALNSYRTANDEEFPNVATVAKAPRNVAGLVVPMLVAQGHLPRDFKIRCPGTSADNGQPFDYEKALAMNDDEFFQNAERFTPCYGYTLGARDQSGKLKSIKELIKEVGSTFPIMADAPPADPLHGNSPNHGFAGQNVLFPDGSVSFLTTRNRGNDGDDIYLNRLNKQEAGVDWNDSVIGHSKSSPGPFELSK